MDLMLVNLRYEARKVREKILWFFLFRVPHCVLYWMVIQATAKYTAEHGDVVVPEATAMDVAKWLEGK